MGRVHYLLILCVPFFWQSIFATPPLEERSVTDSDFLLSNREVDYPSKVFHCPSIGDNWKDGSLLILNEIDNVSNFESIGPNCPLPSQLLSSGATSNSAVLHWTENGSATKWKVIYGPTNFNPNTSGTTIAVNTNPTVIVNGLNSGTTYDFYVKSICGRNNESALVGPGNFTTACSSSTTVPYVIDFNNSIVPNLPACTTRENVGMGNDWETTTNPGLGFNSKVLSYAWNSSSPANAWFYTQGVQLVAGTVYQISYQYGNDNTFGTVEKMKVAYGLSPLAAQMTNILANHPNISNGTANNRIVTFVPPTTSVYYFGFNAYSAQDQYLLFLDNISVNYAPPCPTPSELSVANITQTSADISWTPGLSETQWDVIYGPAGFDPNNSGTTVTVQPSPQTTLTGLNNSTSYEFYVKADCGIGGESSLIGPMQFTTVCSFSSVPYTLDFETSGVPDLPICTTSEKIGNGNNWLTSENPGIGFNGKVLSYAWSTSSAANAWFYTQGVQLIGGQAYQIKYRFGNDNTFGTTEKMKVAYGTSPTASAMTKQLSNHQNISNGIANQNSVVFVPTTSGIYYFGFNAYSNVDQYYLYVDDIEVTYYSGYVYSGGVWTPAHPSGLCTSLEDILVLNGNATLTANTDVKNVTVKSGATLRVKNVLNLYGNIVNNGKLIFISNATGTGELGYVSPTSTITGKATVQNYMSQNRSYRMVSSSVTTSNSIHANWQEGANSNTHNPSPGFGTHITGTTIDQQNGFDKTDTGNPSMFTVNIAAQQFQPIANTNVKKLIAGTPYLLFVRGDRSVDLNNNEADGVTILRATGNLVTGNQTQQFAAATTGDFIMFGNPYQSAVNVNSLFTGLNKLNTNQYYIYDPTLGDHGAYVTVDLPSGTNSSGSAANQYLQPGQAAQVAVLGASPSIIFKETHKAPGNFTTTSVMDDRLYSTNMLTVQMYTSENYSNGGSVHDSFAIIFDSDNDNGLTQADAIKPMNFYENLAIDHEGTNLSIEYRKMPQPNELFHLYSSGYSHSDYTLKVIVDGLDDSVFYLDDHFTGTSTILERGESTYGFRVDPTDPLSTATDRFIIRTEQRLAVEENDLLTGIRMYPNPLKGNTLFINAPNLNGKILDIGIADLTGRIISEQPLECTANTITVQLNDNLASGVYLVTLNYGEESQTFRLIKE